MGGMSDQFQVFISHFAGEHAIAEEIQVFLHDAFPTIKVFRSSDANSIRTAEGQYAAIMGALERTNLMLGLLSSESSRRPWMPFETGFAMGQKTKVFTLLVRGATPSDLPSPFTEMQLRKLDAVEVEKILTSIEESAHVKRAPVGVEALLRGVRKAEQAMPNVKLELHPHMLPYPKHTVSFKLTYEGYEQIALRSITVGFPWEAKDPTWSPRDVLGQFRADRRTLDGKEYLYLQYQAGVPASVAINNPPLRELQTFLYPGDDPNLWELRFALNPEGDFFRDDLLIRYQIDTGKYRTPEQSIPMSAIKR